MQIYDIYSNKYVQFKRVNIGNLPENIGKNLKYFLEDREEPSNMRELLENKLSVKVFNNLHFILGTQKRSVSRFMSDNSVPDIYELKAISLLTNTPTNWIINKFKYLSFSLKEKEELDLFDKENFD